MYVADEPELRYLNWQHKLFQKALSRSTSKCLKQNRRTSAQYQQIDLTANIIGGAENLPFSRARLLQIAENIISNAMKFTPQNAKFTVEELALLKHHVDDAGDEVQIQSPGAGTSIIVKIPL